MKIKVEVESRPCTYIDVDAGVRYWEDAEVDGVEDADGALIPFRERDRWRPRIRLEDGLVVGWPEGKTASIHYKVCDDGLYYIADESGRHLKYAGHYVPDKILAVDGRGYGDYIKLTIRGDGHIERWATPTLDPEEWAPIE